MKNSRASSDIIPLSGGYNAFVVYLHDVDVGPTALSPQRFCEVLGLNLQDFAEQSHVHRNTLIRAPASEGVQRFLREALRVLSVAFDLSGDIHKAIFWYRNESLSAFDGKTAQQLVFEDRADDVVSYVESLRTGAGG